jgi:hypothetical protein
MEVLWPYGRLSQAVLLSAILYVLIYALQEARATGNAFMFTKHGARVAAENRTQFGGVDRSVVSTLGGQWPPTSQAGAYSKGECTNCHEPHASWGGGTWGGEEPYPSAASYPSALMSAAEAQGPDPFLLFSDTQRNISAASDAASFCWTCHESMYLNGFDSGNLHAVHLNYGGGGMMGGWNAITMFTSCANCHYNVHSNAEASNTEYGTAGNGTGLPADGDTHLVNFSPILQPLNNTKPRWYYDGTDMRCNLICHGVSMGTGGCMGGMGGGAVDACYTLTAS